MFFLSTRPALLHAPRLALASLLVPLAAACSSSSSNPAAPGGPGDDSDAGALVDPADSAAPGPDACGVQVASKCKTKNPGSVVRGLIHFDPSLLTASSGDGGATDGAPSDAGASPPTGDPALVVYLMHRQYAQPDEWTKGGHPHAYKKVTNVDFQKGEATFSIDLCEFGAPMWTEDNCDFNLIAIVDRNGNNDPSSATLDTSRPAVPDPGEPSVMKTIQISCFAQSQCVDLKLDCVDGASCVTYSDPGKCTCAAKSCGGLATCTK